MADWFRWWHGTVTDAKFGVISMKANCSLAEVIAVWVYLLEHASQCHVRGDVRHVDCDAVTWALRMRHETVTAIVTAMRDDGLIVDGRLEAWERRQPSREDAVTAGAKTAAQRAKEYRERKKSTAENRHADVTQRHADVTHQSREEKSREDVNPIPNSVLSTTQPETREQPVASTRKGEVCGLLRKAGMADAAPHYLPDDAWDQILSKRTNEEIVELAKAKMATRPGQRTGLKYIAPALLEDPAPITPNARASPRMSAYDQSKLAAARAIFGTEIEGENHGQSARIIDVTPSASAVIGG